MSWFRAYNGISQDAKLHKIATKLGCDRCLVTGAWIAVLDQGSQARIRGDVSHVDGDMLAWVAGMKKTLACRVLKAFYDTGMIASDGMISAWNRRQFESDSSKNRVKAFRDRQANSLDPNDTDPPGNVTVTPSEQNRTEHTPYSPPKGDGGDAPAEPKKADASQAEFDDFYAAYPRKVGKPDALKKYRAARKSGATAEHLQLSLTNWKAYWKRVGREIDKIPHPGTWLHQQRYNDAPDGEGQTPEEQRRQRLLKLVS